MSDAKFGIIILCPEALALFPGADKAPRFGGMGLHMYLLGIELAKNPDFDVCLLLDENYAPEVDVEQVDGLGVRIVRRHDPIRRGLPGISRIINNQRKLEPYIDMPARKVIISTSVDWAPRMLDEARITNAKTIFQVASEWDVNGEREANPEVIKQEEKALREIDVVVCQTEHQSKILLDRLEKESIVIRKGMPIPESLPNLDIMSGVLWVASAQPLKQPWIFLDLARALPHREFIMIMPTLNFAMHEYIRRQSRGIPNLKLIHTQVGYPEIQNYYDNARIFVWTSEFNTHPDITVIQAGTGGAAIVSERLDPEDGMFTKHRTGLLANQNFDLLVRMVDELYDDIDLRKELTTNAFTYMGANYSLKAMGDAYTKLIESLW